MLFKIPKLLFRVGMRCLPTESFGSTKGFYEDLIKFSFCAFSPDNMYSSSVGLNNKSRADERSDRSGVFRFIIMLALSIRRRHL